MRLTRLRRVSSSLILAAPLWGAAFVVSAQPAEPASVAAPAPLPSAPKPSALTPAPQWAGLTAAQQKILAPLEADWLQMSADHRGKWLAIANRIHKLPPEDQARMQERMRDWARLPAAERRQARVAFQAAMQLDAEQRRAKWEAYQALPPERRAQLADTAAKRKAEAARPGAALPAAVAVGGQAKSNLVPAAPKQPPTTAVAASLVQAKPGATTVLMTRPLAMPSHQEAGQPKVIADPGLVDPKTLLPKALRAPTRPTPAAVSASAPA